MFWRKKELEPKQDSQSKAMNPVLLASGVDSINAEMICSILEQNGIVALLKTTGAGGIMKIYFGSNAVTTDIYVDENDFDKAKKLID